MQEWQEGWGRWAVGWGVGGRGQERVANPYTESLSQWQARLHHFGGPRSKLLRISRWQEQTLSQSWTLISMGPLGHPTSQSWPAGCLFGSQLANEELALAWHLGNRHRVKGLAPHCQGGARVTHSAGHGRAGRGAGHQEDSCHGPFWKLRGQRQASTLVGRQAGRRSGCGLPGDSHRLAVLLLSL